MATKIESTEVTQQKKVIVESKAVLEEMKQNGQLEPLTEYYTKEKSETPFMPIGSIFISAIPQTDARVHLLDGLTISQSGAYAKFSNLIKALVSTGNAISCTQAEFDTDVANTGNCGKFVIDDDAGTIRLPKITTFIQGLTDISNIGSSLSAGLPNIEGSTEQVGYSPTTSNNSSSGALQTGGKLDYFTRYKNGDSNVVITKKLTLDASQNGTDLIYGKSDTVQPNATQYPYYIVLASGYKSSEVIDFDNIMNEVNSKLSKNDLYLKYPVGSIYISTDSTSPADAVVNGGLGGGIWEQLPEGLALWTTTTDGEGGNTIEAGLPNITGIINKDRFGIGADWTIGQSGCFTFEKGNGNACNYDSGNKNMLIRFNANNGATVKGIYRDDVTTVQPPAYKVYAWKRVG